MNAHSQDEDPELGAEKNADEADLEPEDSMAAYPGIDFFQKTMHQENLRRLRALEEKQNDMSEILARIEENTKDLPILKADVESLKGDRNKAFGIIAFVVTVTPGLSWLAVRFGAVR